MLQIESKPELSAAVPLPFETELVRKIALGNLHSENPSAEADFDTISGTLIENVRLVLGVSDSDAETRNTAMAASYLYVSAKLSHSGSPSRMAETLCEILYRNHAEWRPHVDEIRRLLAHAFNPGKFHPSASPIELAFHDAVIGLEASPEPRHRPFLLDPGLSEFAHIRRELERLGSLRFSSLLGYLKFGKPLEKSISETAEAAARFGIAAGGPANQKMNLSLYRSVTRNMIDMLTLADRKAGLLLNANAISLTVLVAFFGKNLAGNPKLWASSVLIAGTCALTVIFASLAARPLKRNRDRLTLDEFQSEGLSFLHYADIARLGREEFFQGFQRIAHDPALLERNMLSEIHFFSYRIIDKFRMVRRAYLTMIAGILLSGMALFISHFT